MGTGGFASSERPLTVPEPARAHEQTLGVEASAGGGGTPVFLGRSRCHSRGRGLHLTVGVAVSTAVLHPGVSRLARGLGPRERSSPHGRCVIPAFLGGSRPAAAGEVFTSQAVCFIASFLGGSRAAAAPDVFAC